MKKFFLVSMIMLMAFVGKSVAQNQNPTGEIFNAVDLDESPVFPGGEKEMMKWINMQLRYPAISVENGIYGDIDVGFVVEPDGSITGANVVRSNVRDYKGPVEKDLALEREAKRVVQKMPKWEPGKIKGKPVRARYVVPFRFRLKASD